MKNLITIQLQLQLSTLFLDSHFFILHTLVNIFFKAIQTFSFIRRALKLFIHISIFITTQFEKLYKQSFLSEHLNRVFYHYAKPSQ